MSDPNGRYAMALVLVLSGALAGCATNRTCGSAGCADDAAITANVRALLNQHAELGPPSAIDVKTVDHVVYLNGELGDGAWRDTAGEVAQTAPGVTHVVNSIGITC
jgi:osmotically-inducible protein OsmY